MNCLFVLDPLDSLNLETETSLLLAHEMKRRGHKCSVAILGGLSLTEKGAAVTSNPITVDLDHEPVYQLGPASEGTFANFDLVLMRKDPPVNEAYVFATHVLEQASAEVVVLNDPISLRRFNEKLLPLRFPSWTPPTLVTTDAQRLTAFAQEHREVVLKPLSECSGRGIRLLTAATATVTIQAALADRPGTALLAQKFLPEVSSGDKRIIVLDGEPIGAVNRIPRSAAHLANIHQGARVEPTEITRHEREVIAEIGPQLSRHGLYMAGIDFIGGFLTEINITSPSALRQINAVSGEHLEVAIVDFLERFVTRRQCNERARAID